MLKLANGLLREFPSKSVLIPYDKWKEEAFCTAIAVAFRKMSTEQTDGAKPVTSKAQSVVNEERDTQNPTLVSQLLFSFLGCHGHPTETRAFAKKVRDTVVWGDGSKPWRRSPVWLASKVSLQMLLNTSPLGDAGHTYFKNFQLFAIAQLAQNILDANHLPVHALHNLRTKIAWRASKLAGGTWKPLEDFVESTVVSLTDHVRSVWQEVQQLDQRQLPAPNAHDNVSKHLSMRHSGSALQDILARYRSGETPRHRDFLPHWPTRGDFDEGAAPDMDVFEDPADGSELCLLTDLEAWVSQHLEPWFLHSRRNHEGCTALFALAQTYYDRAVQQYAGDVIQLSTMKLTLLHLWKVMDLIVVELYPELKKFSPEIPSNYLEPLLLVRSYDSERLLQIEKRLQDRHEPKEGAFPSMFGDIHEKSFAVQYYNKHPSLKDLRQKIQDKAKTERKEKEKEHDALLEMYNNLKEICEAIEHDHPHGRARPKKCDKCRLQIESQNLRIDVYEWPLPNSELMLKSVIFELYVQVRFANGGT